MKRKLVKQGSATMMISLPSKWVKENKLDKGSEIDLEEKDNILSVSSSGTQTKKKETNVELKKDGEEDIKNILTHLYRRGFDKIIIEDVSQSALKEIRNVTDKMLLGFELTEKSNKRCVIENISEPTEEKYDVILKRAFLTIREAIDLLIEDSESGKLDNIREMEEMNKQQDKFVLFCRRLLIKGHEKNSILEWELLTFLMHIQHNLYYLYKYSNENKIKIEKKFLDLLRKLKEYFNLYYDAYYHKDINCIYKINNLKKDYQFGECIKLLEKSTGKNSVVYSYTREIFRLIQIGSSPILAEILDAEEK